MVAKGMTAVLLAGAAAMTALAGGPVAAQQVGGIDAATNRKVAERAAASLASDDVFPRWAPAMPPRCAATRRGGTMPPSPTRRCSPAG